MSILCLYIMFLKKPKHFRIVKGIIHLPKNVNSVVIYSPSYSFKVFFFPAEHKIYFDKMLVTKPFWCPLASTVLTKKKYLCLCFTGTTWGWIYIFGWTVYLTLNKKLAKLNYVIIYFIQWLWVLLGAQSEVHLMQPCDKQRQHFVNALSNIWRVLGVNVSISALLESQKSNLIQQWILPLSEILL